MKVHAVSVLGYGVTRSGIFKELPPSVTININPERPDYTMPLANEEVHRILRKISDEPLQRYEYTFAECKDEESRAVVALYVNGELQRIEAISQLSGDTETWAWARAEKRRASAHLLACEPCRLDAKMSTLRRPSLRAGAGKILTES